jgi:hypothetical protein
MNWAWASSLEQLWRSPTFPMWLTLAAAGFFAIILLITLLRAERSVANGALTVITLLAIGIAVAATIRGFGASGETAPGETRVAGSSSGVALPALACIDDLAGDLVLSACEKSLFGSPDAVAAAVSYTAARINVLTTAGDATNQATPELMALRRAIERDRYGFVAYVLSSRDRCKPGDCGFYRALTDHNQIAGNMDEHVYEGLVGRYSATWNVPAAAPGAALAALPPSVPTGKPTNADFPSAASTPAVNIMTAEPPPIGAPPAVRSSTPAPVTTAQSPPRAATPGAAPAAPAVPKKPAAPKRAPTAPTQLAPAAAAPAAAPEPADQ